MLQLRIRQHAPAEGRHRVEVSLEEDGARRTAESTFAFSLSPQDEEDLRWYLEEFLRPPGGCLGVCRGSAAGIRELRGEGREMIEMTRGWIAEIRGQ